MSGVSLGAVLCLWRCRLWCDRLWNCRVIEVLHDVKVLHACEGGACGVAPVPLESDPYLFWPLPDTELLPCVLSSLIHCLCTFCLQELCFVTIDRGARYRISGASAT